jgi:hypothetical protein
MDPNEVPKYKGDEGIVQCCLELGMPEGAVKLRMAHTAVLRREIIPTRIGNANWFSRRDVEEWLRSRKQPGYYHAGEDRVPENVGLHPVSGTKVAQ